MTGNKDTLPMKEKTSQPAKRELDTTPSAPTRKNRPDTQRIRTLQGPGTIFVISHVLLWVIVLISLLLNLTLLRQLAAAQAKARQAVLSAIEVLDDFQGQRFAYTVTIDENLAVNTDMPVDETIPVSIDETLPINTIVTVPVKLGPFGTTNIDIPIATVIPVDLDFNVEIDQTFQVNTAVPINLEVPIEIAVEDTPLHGTLSDVQAQLYQLADELAQPISLFPSLKAEPTIEGVE